MPANPSSSLAIINQVFEVGVGLVTVLVLAPTVTSLVRWVDNQAALTPPAGVDPTRWRNAIQLSGHANIPNRWLGRLEAILFFISFWLGAYVLAGGWLAFKVASKWETWQSIMKVPEHLPSIDELDFFAARNQWGSNLLQRWLIGTLANILVGMAAVGVAKGLGYFLIRCLVS